MFAQMSVTDRENQVLTLIKENPMMAQDAIAQQLGISRSAVAGHITNLSKKGIIKGRGYVLDAEPFVAVIGGINVDIHGVPDQALINKDSNPGKVITCAGGVARNIAENLSRLGIHTRLLAPLGSDSYGEFLQKHCEEAGIDMDYVLKLSHRSTSTYLSILDQTGAMQLALSDMAIMESLDPAYLKNHKAMLKQAALMVVDCNLSTEALEYLFSEFADQIKFVDTVSASKAPKIKPFLHNIHTLKASRAEAEAIAGIKVEKTDNLSRLAVWFHQQGLHRLVISLAEQGVFYSTPEGHKLQPAIKAKTVQNTGGAGDAFVAGLSFAELMQWPTERCIGFAQATAVVTISNENTNDSALSLQHVEKVFEEHYADTSA